MKFAPFKRFAFLASSTRSRVIDITRSAAYSVATAIITIGAVGLRPASAADKDLPNFAVVAPGIYRGAAPTAAGLRKLRAMGVQTIVDLRIEKKGQAEEAATASALGMERIRLKMGREAPTSAQVKTFLATLDNAPQKPVFVHCQHGADRTGAMMGIWRETRQNWSFPATYKEMRRYGFKPYLTELKGAVATRAKKR